MNATHTPTCDRCSTCGGTAGFVNNRGTLDVCDDPWHDEHEAKHALTPLTVETDAEGRFILNGHDVVWHSTYVHVVNQREALVAALEEVRAYFALNGHTEQLIYARVDAALALSRGQP